MNVFEIKYEDEMYPKKLKEISNPPKVLYYLGDISLLNTRMISVVGSRNCTDYGKNVAFKIGEKAASYGVTIVSGMAKGIDYYSHLGALSNNGKTIAVLGSGVNVCYPRSSEDIYKSIKEKGLVISEVPPNSLPTAYNFPLRNRIVAALSEATIVVEAEISSGSMITAELANEQGKNVYSVPGSILSLNSFGTNKLIQDGGKILISIDEIFKDMGFRNIEKQNTDMEQYLLEILKNKGEISIKELANISRLNEKFVKEIVGELAIKGCIFYELGKIIIAN